MSDTHLQNTYCPSCKEVGVLFCKTDHNAKTTTTFCKTCGEVIINAYAPMFYVDYSKPMIDPLSCRGVMP